MATPAYVESFSNCLGSLGWVSDLWVGGSLATGDYRPGVSDLDLVAIVAEDLDAERQQRIREVHRDFDDALGCAYIDVRLLGETGVRHPTWTHGTLVQRPLSRIARAELSLHGVPLFGLEPSTLLGATSDSEVRSAAHAELRGYWTWAARRPWLWLSPEFAELGLVTMARARHAMRTGALITKSEAIGEAAWPAWVSSKLALRRRGDDVALPRLRLARLAWVDACRTTLGAATRR